MSPYEVVNTSGLPYGTYTVYFGVDMDYKDHMDHLGHVVIFLFVLLADQKLTFQSFEILK